MERSSAEIARALEQLERRVAAIETALAAVGGTLPGAPAPGTALRAESAVPIAAVPEGFTPDAVAPVPSHDRAAPPPADEQPPLIRSDWVTVPALVGRTFLALAGAYLLRALTDAGTLPPAVGVGAGLAYAALWFFYADRAAAGGRTSAGFHGLVGALVAFPLIWEATTRFQLLTPVQTAAALAAVAAVGLGVSAHRHLHAVAWIVALLGASAASALVPATDRIAPFAVFLIALGVATLWLGYTRNWLVLRWPIAAFADFAVVGITVRVVTAHGVETPALALAVQVLLIAGYLVSIMIRTLVRGRDVIPFEMVQGVLALAVGLGGAVAVAGLATVGAIAVGTATLLLGVTCYALAFVFVARRQGMRANFYFYSTLGLMLVLASAHLLLETSALTVALAALTVTSAVVAASTGPRFVVTHAAVYGVTTGLASGLLYVSTFRLIAPVSVEWPSFAWPMLLAVAALAASEAVPVPHRGGTWDFWSHPPRLVLLLLTMWGGAGWVIEFATRALAAGPASIDPGTLATVRTAVLSLAALGLARLGCAEAYREARWVVYPLLFVGGAKLLMEDLPRSRPATLFVAFALYGVALIFAPRLCGPKAADRTVDPEPLA